MDNNPVVHFEMPYEDRGRVARFYERAFGWKTRALGEEMGNYVTATTTDTNQDGPTQPGRINGGFFPKKPDWPSQEPNVVIAVKDLKKAMQDVKSAGGEVLGEPMEIPGIGDYVSFRDSEGNRVAMMRPFREDAYREG